MILLYPWAAPESNVMQMLWSAQSLRQNVVEVFKTFVQCSLKPPTLIDRPFSYVLFMTHSSPHLLSTKLFSGIDLFVCDNFAVKAENPRH